MTERPPRGRRSAKGAVPDRTQVLDFIRSSPVRVGKREIARAFGLTGAGRIALKRLLASMADEGLLPGRRKNLGGGPLPPVLVLEVTGRDADGDLLARPATWDDRAGAAPAVLLLPARGERRGIEADISVGDRVLAEVTRLNEPDVEGVLYEATPIKRLPRDERRPLGLFRVRPAGGVIEPIDRRDLRAWPVSAEDTGGAANGDLVRFGLVRRGRFGDTRARVTEVLGNPEDECRISLIAIHAYGLPCDFPEDALREAEALEPFRPDGRVDLRAVPLVTIDPEDARDHDDAVYAEPDKDAGNKGGFAVTVAIADVAHYVRPGSHLDREAQKRGNSVYFPGSVVPMLPERISNDLCSLREGEDRPCLAVRLVFNARGEKRGQTFFRAVMRSAAKLSYEEAQAAFDGQVSAKCQPLMADALRPLWNAYTVLAAARDRRAPLDLDIPERRIVLDGEGRVARVFIPGRLAAHRLIEEFMIQANVAAAEALEAAGAPVVYRVHGEPSSEKYRTTAEFLATLGLKLPRGEALKPAAFNRILARARSLPVAGLVNEVVLRTQSQAEYSIANEGHFGLNLARYAHFTSPIRRYADLLVHRALIGALGFGAGGLEERERGRLAETAKAISEAERRAMAAERETVDRLIAAHLADRVGAAFAGRIAGVTRAGLFVRLSGTGADGFVPVSTLPGDYYRYDESTHALTGTRSGEMFQLGDAVEVRLAEAIPSAGALRFEMLAHSRNGGAARSAPKGKKTKGRAAAGLRRIRRTPKRARG